MKCFICLSVDLDLRSNSMGKVDEIVKEGENNIYEKQVCAKLSRIIIQVGEKIWDSIHYPLLMDNDRSLVNCINERGLKSLQDEGEIERVLLLDARLVEDLARLTVALTRKSYSDRRKKNNYQHGIFRSSIINISETRLREMYVEELMFVAKVVSSYTKPFDTQAFFRECIEKRRKNERRVKKVDNDYKAPVDNNQFSSTTKGQNDHSSIATLHQIYSGASLDSSTGERQSPLTPMTQTNKSGSGENDLFAPSPITEFELHRCLSGNKFTGHAETDNKEGILTLCQESPNKDELLLEKLNTRANQYYASPNKVTDAAAALEAFRHDVAAILKTYGHFCWEVKYSSKKHNQTPTNGLCFFYIHMQGYHYTNPSAKLNKFPNIESSCFFQPEGIDYLRKELDWILANRQLYDGNDAAETAKLVAKLQYLIQYVENADNAKVKSYTNKDNIPYETKYGKYTTSAWGDCTQAGTLFLPRGKRSFSFYQMQKNVGCLHEGYMRLMNVTCCPQANCLFPFAGVWQFSQLEAFFQDDICGSHEFAGCYNEETLHFHPVKVGAQMLLRMQMAFESCLDVVVATLQYNFENNLPLRVDVHKVCDLNTPEVPSNDTSMMNDTSYMTTSSTVRSVEISAELKASMNDVQSHLKVLEASDCLKRLQKEEFSAPLLKLIKSVQAMMTSLTSNDTDFYD